MRIVPLKSFDELKFEDSPEADYAYLMKAALNRPGDNGFSPDLMRKTLKILDAIDAAQGADYVELEEDHWLLLCHQVNLFPYGMVHKELVEYIDDVTQAPEKELTEAADDDGAE